MAGDLNRVTIIGRLTRDPELRQINTGTSLCRFSIANNRNFSQNGEKKEEVSFFNCTAWGRQAEIIQQYCQRGKQVAIEGRLRQNSWQDSDGKKKSSVEIVVEQLQLLGSPSGPNNTQPMQEVSQQFEPVSSMQPSASSSDIGDTNTMDDDDVPF